MTCDWCGEKIQSGKAIIVGKTFSFLHFCSNKCKYLYFKNKKE